MVCRVVSAGATPSLCAHVFTEVLTKRNPKNKKETKAQRKNEHENNRNAGAFGVVPSVSGSFWAVSSVGGIRFERSRVGGTRLAVLRVGGNYFWPYL